MSRLRIRITFILVAVSLCLLNVNVGVNATARSSGEIIRRRVDRPSFLRVSNWLHRFIDPEPSGSERIQVPEYPGTPPSPPQGYSRPGLFARLSRSLGRRRNPFAALTGGAPTKYYSGNQEITKEPAKEGSFDSYENVYSPLPVHSSSSAAASSSSSSSSSSSGSKYYKKKYRGGNSVESHTDQKTHYPDCGMDYKKFDQRCCWEEENYMRTQMLKEEQMGYVVDAGSYYWDENRGRCLMSVNETPMALMNDIRDPDRCIRREDCSWFEDSETCQCYPELVGKRVYRGSSYKIYKPRGRWS